MAFVVVGVVIYQLTAPAGQAGRGFSLGRLIQSARREIQGNQAQAEHTTQTTAPIDAAVDELRIGNVRNATLIGENRENLQLELAVSSTGFDTAEAEKLASGTALRVDASGRVVTLSVDYPEGGQQRATLTVRLPARLRVRVQGVRGETKASGVAALYLDNTRGDVTVERVADGLEGSHTGGNLQGTDVGSVDLTTRSSDLRLDRIRGGMKLDLTGGTLRASALKGDFQFDGRSAEIEVDGLGGTARLTARGGRLTLRGITREVRVEGRSTDLTFDLAVPAPITALTSDGTIDLTAPAAGGFTLDAAATNGQIRLTDLDVKVTKDGSTERASGAVRGGGPTVALRDTDGGINVRGRTTPR